MSLPEDYRDYFIRNLHDALSGHSSNDVAEAVKYSEKSKTKCIGITIETRPDYCLKRHLSDMLLYGCTRCLIFKNDFNCFFPELDSVLNLKMENALCQLFQHYQSLSSFANAYNLSTTAFFHLSSAANLE